MSQVLDKDPWLGSVRQFPPVLHARASLVYDVTTETLQKVLVSCLLKLQESTRTIELSLSDQTGYSDGTVGFRVGVGNNDGFDILDAQEEDRVLRKILATGSFPILDLSLDLHYKIQSTGRHRVARDRYLTRLTFHPGGAELLVHHLKGLKRIDPDELVRILLSTINAELARRGYGEIELEESHVD